MDQKAWKLWVDKRRKVTASGHCEKSAGAIIEGRMNYAESPTGLALALALTGTMREGTANQIVMAF